MAAAFSAWDRLIAVTTMGLARHTEELSGLLPDAAIVLPAGSREQMVLRSAAATLVWRLAGARAAPQESPHSPIPAAAATHVVSKAAARRLAQMLVDEPKMFAQEWFERARDVGAVLPPQWVATIFDAVTPAAREAYVEVFGERLSWLATLDPRWHA